jgi:hypothetical protein
LVQDAAGNAALYSWCYLSCPQHSVCEYEGMATGYCNHRSGLWKNKIKFNFSELKFFEGEKYMYLYRKTGISVMYQDSGSTAIV